MRFGPTIGPHLRVLGLGGDDWPLVDEPHVPAVAQPGDHVHPRPRRPRRDRRARRCAGAGGDGVGGRRGPRTVTHVAVKVRTATFFTRTKISKLPAPTTDPAVVAAMAATVLARFELDRPVRLLGVRVVLDVPA